MHSKITLFVFRGRGCLGNRLFPKNGLFFNLRKYIVILSYDLNRSSYIPTVWVVIKHVECCNIIAMYMRRRIRSEFLITNRLEKSLVAPWPAIQLRSIMHLNAIAFIRSCIYQSCISIKRRISSLSHLSISHRIFRSKQTIRINNPRGIKSTWKHNATIFPRFLTESKITKIIVNHKRYTIP